MSTGSGSGEEEKPDKLSGVAAPLVSDRVTIRESRPGVVQPPPKLSKEELAEREAANGIRQSDKLFELIEAYLPAANKPFRLRPSMIMELNRIAVDGLEPRPGSYRDGPIEISSSLHQPPDHNDVPLLVEELCEHVEREWPSANPINLA